MAEKDAIYKCSVCGNVVEVLEAHEGSLVCCDKEMEKQEPKGKEQEGREKHVPVAETEGNKVNVKVGSVPHPMEEEHHIKLIEVLKEGKVIASARLYPGEKPEAEFCLEQSAEGLTAREYCNIHGLWKA